MKPHDGQELMHRVRIGLTGLACVFLIVLMGAIFAKFVREGEAERVRSSMPPGAASSPADVRPAAPSDPLAELGVAPGNPDEDLNPPGNQTTP